MTSIVNDGLKQVGAVNIHDLYLQPDVPYDEGLNFDFNAGSNGIILNVIVNTIDVLVGIRINGNGWQIVDCTLNTDDSAIIINANATNIYIAGLLADGPFDDYAVIINGNNNTLIGSPRLGGGISILGDDNLIIGNILHVATPDTNGIRVSGDRNLIVNNKVYPDGGTVTVGVDIIAGATDNIIGWNDLTGAVTEIVDAGTNTTIWNSAALAAGASFSRPMLLMGG